VGGIQHLGSLGPPIEQNVHMGQGAGEAQAYILGVLRRKRRTTVFRDPDLGYWLGSVKLLDLAIARAAGVRVDEFSDRALNDLLRQDDHPRSKSGHESLRRAARRLQELGQASLSKDGALVVITETPHWAAHDGTHGSSKRRPFRHCQDWCRPFGPLPPP
jgi:hypothetical protein